MDNSQGFVVEKTRLQPVYGDITELKADALVQPAGNSPDEESFVFQASPWVVKADSAGDGSISASLARHAPLEIGQVLVTTAGNLPAQYLIHAVVVNWKQSPRTRALATEPNTPTMDAETPVKEMVNDNVVETAARQCIAIASALGLASIAFTPWGTHVGAKEVSVATAIMLQAIVAQLQEQATSLQTIYLISHNKDHYKSFEDRAFVFSLFAEQMARLRKEIRRSGISPQEWEKIAATIAQAQRSVVTNYNHYVVQRDLVTVEKGNYQPEWTVETVNQAMGNVNAPNH